MIDLPGLGTGHSGGGLLGCEKLSAYVLSHVSLLFDSSPNAPLILPVHVRRIFNSPLVLTWGGIFGLDG